MKILQRFHIAPSVPLHKIMFATLLGFPQLSLAEPGGQPRVHTVQAGDTYYRLSKRYLKDPALWPSIAHANPGLDWHRLQLGELVKLPDVAGRAWTAVVLNVRGSALVTRKGSMPVDLVKGDVLTEGDALNVQRDADVALRLEDGSVMRVQEDTRITLQQLRVAHEPQAPKSTVRVYLNRGRIESEVGPRQTGSRFEVRTPLAIAGVRGTQFGVSYAPGQASMAVDVLQGNVTVDDSSRGLTKLTALQGAFLARGSGGFAQSALLAAPDLSLVPAILIRDSEAINFGRVPQAVAYKAVLTHDAALQNVVKTHMVAEPSITLDSLDEGDYYLSVRAVDQHGIHGAPAQMRVGISALPEAPFLLKPERAEKIRAMSPVLLTCTEVHGAATYRFQLSLDPEFHQLLRDERVVDLCQMPVLVKQGVHYWRAATIARLPDGREMMGAFSTTSSFKAVDAPSAREPKASATGVDRIGLQWLGEAGLTYHLQLSRREDFAPPHLRELKLTEPHVDLQGLNPGSYFVRLNTIDADGIESGFSMPRHFQVVNYLRSDDGGLVQDSSGLGVDVFRP